MNDRREHAHELIDRLGETQLSALVASEAGAGVREIEWTQPAVADLAALDKGVASRVKQAVDPPECRLRVGDWRVRNRREAYR